MRAALKRIYFALSGDSPLNCWIAEAADAAFLPLLPDPPDGPLSFLTDADLDAHASLERTGMVGAFNRYRASAVDAAENADIVGATVGQPSCFIAGHAIRCGRSSPAATDTRTRIGMHRLPRQHDHRAPATGCTKSARPR